MNPEQPRTMTNEEGETYFNNMLEQIIQCNPTEIVAVHRSGFALAMWVSQILKLPLGVYYPDTKRLQAITRDRLVFVDDNIVNGETYTQAREHLAISFKWAVLFIDWNAPEAIRNDTIAGIRLPYYALEPVWASRKISTSHGTRYRDENRI
jgi:hypothetical protein